MAMASEGARRPPARHRRLKPRPGRSGEKVAAHQRGRIYEATIELVAEDGYDDLTATAISGVAGVSKRTFYENFEDKEECFLATYDRIVRHTAREVLAAQRGARSWQEDMRAAFGAFAREVAERPQAARLALVEVFAAGPAAFERVQHTGGLFEALVGESFAKPRDGVELSPLLIKGIVAGEARVARARLLSGRERELPEETDALMSWALSLRDRAAREVCGVCPGSNSPQPEPLDGEPRSGALVELLGDERAVILFAAADLAAKEGYAALTAPGIRRAAGVSRRRFDAHFEDVADCFLAAVELLIGRAMAAARNAFRGPGGWPRAMHRGLTAFCAQIAADPTLLRLVFLEVPVAGCKAVRWGARFIADFAALLCGTAPVEQRPSELEAEASVAAVWALLHHYVTAGRASQLPQLAGTLTYLVLAPAIGAEQTAEAIRAEQALSARQATATSIRR
jgi:AcrR family transcriptional regulator